MFGTIIGRCNVCNKLSTGTTLIENEGVCNRCYYIDELCECSERGREIAKFDFNDFGGMCGHCKDGLDES